MGDAKKEDRLKVILWNIAGIKKVWETWNFLKKFDIIILQETWVEKEREKGIMGRLSKDYIWKAKSAIRKKKKGRAAGGLLLGIKKGAEKGVNVEEWEHGLIANNVNLNARGKVTIVTAYNNSGIKNVINDLRDKVMGRIENGEHVILAGD